ncbi:NAD(P)/FAD-dependent oxidoreductase [Anditalea andensis]|uniref:Amino acid oxidase n=1 Tax=Anditalea andensis TaxID=1048983 RepID=A0A074L2G9_9BACT|nr:FAD-dependent oxidoreductase [Anditalea andensis]KEO74645.1 amino acid oxidase [Anditalea andensis]
MEVDFLLIGQGLAGTILAHRLRSAGKQVGIIDLAKENKSSRIAAGLYNPITGKKLVKTWNADKIFPEIERLYQELEKELGVKILYPTAIYRPFLSIEEQNEWMGYSSEDNFEDYIEEIRTKSYYQEVNDSYGGVLLKNSGYVDINTLLDAYQQKLIGERVLLDDAFQEDLLRIREDGVLYKDIKAGAIVYTNGLGAMKSRFFEKLPFAPVKGEILVLKQPFIPKEIINRGVFRITLPNGTHRVGSTYSWDDLDQGPTERAKKEILEKYEKLIKIPENTIIEHATGIRPATRDRKPILGKHPDYRNVYIFNGLGAKGVSLAPYYSLQMRDLLIFDKEVEKDVNISRFFKYI